MVQLFRSQGMVKVAVGKGIAHLGGPFRRESFLDREVRCADEPFRYIRL